MQAELQQEISDRGFVELYCFWEPNAGFERSPLELSIGDQLRFSVGNAQSRIGIYIAKDVAGQSVGMLMNLMDVAGEYYEFADALTDVLGKSRFKGQLLSITDEREESNRIYFTVKAIPVDNKDGAEENENRVG
jgi:hypothetical protein